jgi:hypothetical protein
MLPSPFQFLWGDWVFRHLLNRPAPGEFIMGWGFMAWLFGLYSLKYVPRPAARPWLAVVLVAVGLSFGLTLHLAGRQIVIPASPAVVERVNQIFSTISTRYALTPEPFTLAREDGLIIPLPALLLRWFVPVLGSLRTWTRFGGIALFGAAVLAALGATAWHRREIQPKATRRQQQAAWGVVISLALFELWWAPLSMITPVLARPVDNWLAAQPGHEAIIEYPLNSSFNGQQLVYTRAHGRPIVHGYGLFLGFMFGRHHPELLEFPTPAAIRRLADWRVRYVLIETAPPYTAEVNNLLTAVSRESCLQPRTVQGTVYVFELVGCLP